MAELGHTYYRFPVAEGADLQAVTAERRTVKSVVLTLTTRLCWRSAPPLARVTGLCAVVVTTSIISLSLRCIFAWGGEPAHLSAVLPTSRLPELARTPALPRQRGTLRSDREDFLRPGHRIAADVFEHRFPVYHRASQSSDGSSATLQPLGSALSAAVIGAGPAGLAAAIALRHSGVDAHVYESTEQFRESGTGVVLWPNGIRALRRVDASVAARVEGGELGARYRNAQGADAWTKMFGAPGVIIRWSSLQRGLYEALPRDRVHMGRRLRNFEQGADGVRLHFDLRGRNDGGKLEEVRHHDFIVGADGIRSAVRTCAAGNHSTPRMLDGSRHLLRAVLNRSALPSEVWQRSATTPEQTSTRMWASRNSALGVTAAYMDVGEGYAYWAVGVLDETAQRLMPSTASSSTSKGGDVEHDRALAIAALEAALQEVREDADARETLELTLAMVQATTSINGGRSLSLTPCDKAEWAQDAAVPVTLTGDAMHAVAPSFGQGACLALEDAFALARALGPVAAAGGSKQEVAAALRRYEAERLPRTFQAQIASYRSAMASYGKDGTEFDAALLNFTSFGGISSWLMQWDGETMLP